MGTTLLLADDSITIQKVVGIIFANEDYELVVVDNGISALEKAKECRPDVMLVDALMPGKNGYEVCEEVRRDPGLRDVPLLLLVGAFEPFDEDRARTSGADDHITKPFESQNLIDKVRELAELGRSRASVAPVQEEQAADGTMAAAHPEVVASEPFVMPVQAGQVSQEPFAAAQEPEELPEGSAKLADSFRGFVHLGGSVSSPEAVEPPVEEITSEIPAAVEVESPAAVEVEADRVILLSTVDIVEAAPEDDPWGTFAEEVTEGEPIQFGEMLDGEEPIGLADRVEEIEPFSLLDDETSRVSFGSVMAPEPGDTEPPAGSPAEEETSFSGPESEPADCSFTWLEPPAGEVASESISLGEEPMEMEPAPAWESAPAAEPFASFGGGSETGDLPFAAEEEYVPAAESSAAPTETPESSGLQIPGPVVQPGAEHLVTLSEGQLAAAISRISREVIERIAWEVVPDLAETIIKEEIRKIKEGMSR